MALEVPQERVVMSREVANPIIDFGTGVDDGGCMMGKAGKMGTILL